ncbi:MAG: hypothetical protein Q8P67_25365, partial [archaeon]|nr:hypothetical protein [archaeon]
MASSSNRKGPSSSELRELRAPSDYKSAKDEVKHINELLAAPPKKVGSPLDATIIIDGLPSMALEKKAAILKVLKKLLSDPKHGEPKEIVVPDDGKMLLGYAFVQFATEELALANCARWNTEKLNNKKVKANRFSDFDKFEKVPNEFTPPEIQANEKGDFLGWWLLEGHRSDQYAIRYGLETEIYWNELNKKTEPIRARREWTDNFGPEHPGFTWSPHGSFLVTFHGQGLILWGGPQFTRFHRFEHKNVFRIDFSPRENYLVSVSRELDNKMVMHPKEIVIWDVRTEQTISRHALDSSRDRNWPIFTWSHDDKYFARKSSKGISVVEVASKTKIKDSLGKAKDLEIPGLVDYSWSPSQNIIACYISAEGNRPARVDLIEIPSRRVLQTRTSQYVDSVHLIWHPQGDFLGALFVRFNKSQTKKSNHLEIFRLRQKLIPTEALDIADEIISNEGVPQLSWEPRGTRFAFLHRENGTNAPRPNVSFYNVSADKVVPLKTLEKRSCTTLVWAPNGRFVVMVGYHQ